MDSTAQQPEPLSNARVSKPINYKLRKYILATVLVVNIVPQFITLFYLETFIDKTLTELFGLEEGHFQPITVCVRFKF